jgi:predicted aspartyl protease
MAKGTLAKQAGATHMENDAMGRVLTEATMEHLGDLWDVTQGRMTPDQVRRITVTDALVDTGATALALPTRLIQQLGLRKVYQKRALSTKGIGEVDVYEPVRLTIQGRSGPFDVMEVPDDLPVLVGQMPLEYFDLVVDPRSRRLIGNPAHGGEHILELL